MHIGEHFVVTASAAGKRPHPVMHFPPPVNAENQLDIFLVQKVEIFLVEQYCVGCQRQIENLAGFGLTLANMRDCRPDRRHVQ